MDSFFGRARAWFTDKNLKILLATAFAGFFIQAMQRGLFRARGNDLTIYMELAGRFFGGQNPYGIERGLLYPLFVLFPVEALNGIPEWLAHVIWYAANLALFLWISRVAQERIAGTAFDWRAFSVAFLLLVETVQSNLVNAQINIVVMSCAVGFAVFLKEGRENIAALLLAVAVSLKVTPLFLLVFLFVGRKFAAAVKTVLLILALVFLVPFLKAGWEVMDYYGTYRQTIMGIVAADGMETADLIFSSSAIVFGFLLLGLIQTVFDRRAARAAHEAIYLYFTLMPALLPAVLEPHHMIWLFPSVLAVAHDVVGNGVADMREKLLAGGLVLFFAVENAVRNGPFEKTGYYFLIVLVFVMIVFRMAGRVRGVKAGPSALEL